MTDRTPEDAELRDRFAMAAMQELIRSVIAKNRMTEEEACQLVSRSSYRMADAMMAERVRT